MAIGVRGVGVWVQTFRLTRASPGPPPPSPLRGPDRTQAPHPGPARHTSSSPIPLKGVIDMLGCECNLDTVASQSSPHVDTVVHVLLLADVQHTAPHARSHLPPNSFVAAAMADGKLAESATERPFVSTVSEDTATEHAPPSARYVLLAERATERPTESNDIGTERPTTPTPDQPGTRYLASIYSLNPTRRPEVHRVVCIMLLKAVVSDGDLKAFIAQHIATAIAPCFRSCCSSATGDSEMSITNFAIPESTQPLPMVCRQLLDYCSRPAARRFHEPLLDGAGYTVGFLSLRPWEWQHTVDVVSMRSERLRAESWKCQKCRRLLRYPTRV